MGHSKDREDTAKRGNLIPIQAYLKKIETFQINNLTLCLQELEEQKRQPLSLIHI